MGRTCLLANITDKPAYREGLPHIIDVDYVPFGPEGVPILEKYLKEHSYAAMTFELIQGEGGKKYVYARIEGEKAFAHLLNRRKFKTKWQKMKAMMIRSALLVNQGSSSDIFPTPFLQGDEEELYPMDWLEGFVHPYLLMQW